MAADSSGGDGSGSGGPSAFITSFSAAVLFGAVLATAAFGAGGAFTGVFLGVPDNTGGGAFTGVFLGVPDNTGGGAFTGVFRGVLDNTAGASSSAIA